LFEITAEEGKVAMRILLTRPIIFLGLLFIFSPGSQAQVAKQSKIAISKPFDPRDLSGVWGGQSIENMTKDEPPMTPWAMTKYKSAKTNWSNPPVLGAEDNDPILRCEPAGVPRIYNGFAHPMSFIQTNEKIVILYEADRVYRIIYMNRKHPEHADSLWYGDSIGTWDGNTLVVDTIDFNDRTWLDRSGHPHSDKLHLVERFVRVDHGHLQIDITVDDPIAYTKPWGGRKIFKLEPASWELEEYMCDPEDEEKVLKQIMVPEAAPTAPQ
jgi:hypothetical protein